MKKIPLTQGQIAIVDDEDFDKLNQFKWCAAKTKDGDYMAVRNSPNPNRHLIYMHRQIMDFPKGMEVDHIFHNRLDNRKAKLRICTHRQNLQNGLSHKDGNSRYKGIYWHKRDKKWLVQIMINGKIKHLGRFNSEIEAAKIYDVAAIEKFGEFALLNFNLTEYNQ
jgi:hypothetical protein